MFSGLQANASRLIGQDYMDNAKGVEVERANKLAGISLQESQAKTGYDSGVSQLTSKYSGLKNQYIIEQQHAQEQRDFQAQQAAADRAAAAAQAAMYARGSGGGGSSASKPTVGQLFDGYDPKNDKWFTEKTVIPELMSSYGYTKDQAAKIAYDYRKAKFNE
jgi:hypothetical protein